MTHMMTINHKIHHCMLEKLVDLKCITVIIYYKFLEYIYIFRCTYSCIYGYITTLIGESMLTDKSKCTKE